MIKLSIIIIKYKSEKFLGNCLKSIGKSKDWECIVVDNDKDNVGYGAGCNLGAKRANKEYFFKKSYRSLIGWSMERFIRLIGG